MRKQKWIFGILVLIILLIGCEDNELEKPSLLLKYYSGASNWADIILGETTLEVTQRSLNNLEEVHESSMIVGPSVRNFEEAVCIDFIEGFRENGLCVHHLNGKAQVIVFYGFLTIEEIEQNLSTPEKIAILFHNDEHQWISSYGISESVGYVLAGGAEADRVDEATQHATISSDTLAGISLVNPELIKFYMYNAVIGEAYTNYLFGEGFEDWHGPGEYDVLHWSPFD
jgi:hypothetical protein